VEDRAGPIPVGKPRPRSPTKDGELAGRTLGDFVVAEKIGEGGFGAVYRAHQPLLDRPAVIKVLHTRLRATGAATERFLREARLASRLDHPYAAHIYAFGAEPDGTLWIAMELVRGTSLAEYLRVNGPLSVEKLVPLLERICEVVHTAHEQGIIHRDLKPANVMVVARAGRLLPKLLDFGIAKSLLDVSAAPEPESEPPVRESYSKIGTDDTMAPPSPDATVVGPRSGSGPRNVELAGKLTHRGAVMGSPHYMAPEQWEDATTVTARTDLYALGILAYEALTGVPPFRATSVQLLAAAHTQDPVPPLPASLPRKLDAAFARALAKQPEARFSTALEMAAAFRSAAGLEGEKRPLPQLDDAIRQQYLSEAPQPIAEAVATLEAARDARQARDALWLIPSVLVRWLGVTALAARSRLGTSHDAANTVSAVRELGTTVPSDDTWLDATLALVRGYAEKPDLHPIPELVMFVCDPGDRAGAGEKLYRELAALRPGLAEASANDDEVIARLQPALVLLSRLLRAASFVCKYPLVLPAGDGFAERWSGARRAARVQVVSRGSMQAGRPILIDPEGAPVIALHPLVQVAAPMAGNERELFMFSGRDVRGAKLAAPPSTFELHDPQVLDWLRLQMASTLDAERVAATTERAPYRGLAAFKADDASYFFGREQAVDAFVNRLRVQPLIAVVGPSGAGKSSFVQAGVIPALGEDWRAIIVRPGQAPLVALASRLASARIRASELPARLREDPARLGDLLRDDAMARGPIVLIVDQLEELFTLCRDAIERNAFAAAIASAGRSVDDPVRVILTLRDDFLVTAQMLASLRDRIGHGLQLLTTPSRDDLERVLVEPARRVGYEFEDPELPARMVAEVADRPGALALLSFTAAQLWEQRDRHFRRLPTKAYELLGGVGGALARHAEGLLENEPAHEQRLIREAFRHLVTAEGTRAVLSRRELAAVMGEGAESVIERLVASRLLTAREGDSEEQIEIAHEALITAWPRLVEWQREDREGARLRDQLRSAARQWDSRGRPRGLLWRDDALVELQLWRSRYPGALTETEDAFAKASIADAARGRRLRRGILVTVLALMAVAVAVLIYARDQAAQQREAAREAAARERERSIGEIVERARTATLANRSEEARAAIDDAIRLGSTMTPSLALLAANAKQAQQALVATLRGHDNAIQSVELGADGHLLTASMDMTARLWDSNAHRVLATLSACRVQLWAAKYSPAKDRVALDCSDGNIYVYAAGGVLQQTLRAAKSVAVADFVSSVFAPNGNRIATVADGIVKMWDARTGAEQWSVSMPLVHELTTFSRDGARLVTSAGGDATGGGTVTIWDANTGRVLHTLATGYVRWMDVDPTNTWLATGGNDKVVRVWRLADGHLQRSLVGHSGFVERVKFSADGSLIASVSRDSTLRLWRGEADAQHAGELVISLPVGSGFVTDMAFDATGKLVAGTSDGLVMWWDTSTLTPLAVFEASAGVPVRGVAIDPRGSEIVAVSDDRLVRIWRPTVRTLRAVFPHGGRVFDTVFVGGDRVFTFGNDGTVKLWNAHAATLIAEAKSDGEVEAAAVVLDGDVIWGDATGNIYRWNGTGSPHVIAKHAGWVRRIVVSPDKKLIASSGADRIVLLTPVGGGAPIRLDGHEPETWGVAFSPDGQHVATGDGKGQLRLWRLDGTLVTSRSAHTNWISAVQFTRDGRLVSASADTTVAISSSRLEPLRVLRGHSMLVNTLVLDGDDKRAVTTSPDGTARIWDLDTGMELVKLQDHGILLASAFLRDDALVATVGDSSVVRVWDSRTGRELLRLPGHTDLIFRVRAPTGDQLVTSGFDGKALLWQLPDH
jgi:WD40 repeat protein/serine/threonine protein kinase